MLGYFDISGKQMHDGIMRAGEIYSIADDLECFHA